MNYYFCHYCHTLESDDFSDQEGYCNVCGEMQLKPRPVEPPFQSFQGLKLHLQDGDPDGYVNPEKLRTYEAGIRVPLEDFPDKSEQTFFKK